MQAACAGDRAAYEALLADIAGMLRAHARARLARSGFGPEEAEDVVQETLIALHAKRHTWDPERPILPWIQAIARHKTVDASAARDAARTPARSRTWPICCRPEPRGPMRAATPTPCSRACRTGSGGWSRRWPSRG